MSKKKSPYIYINAVQKLAVPYTPIWIMRQAGRYLPEYLELRSRHSFLTVCKTPELATEVTLQPIRRFGFDASILFSDILVIPEALGQKLEFLENHGPKLSPQILVETGIESLHSEGLLERLSYVKEAVEMIRGELPAETALIGFSGSPFTLATYMIEGKPTRNFKHIKQIIYREPERLTQLLELLTGSVVDYLRMQIAAGANAVQVFDTWGGILPVHLFNQFSGRYLQKIAAALKTEETPVTLFSKGGLEILQRLTDSEAAVLGVDWMTDMQQAYTAAGAEFALQGNLDPTALYGSKEIIREEVSRILNVFKGRGGHIFNLGHGILPDIPVDNVYVLIDEVREQSTRLNEQYI
jgi:uroporphyrinogen decarboxylase